MQAARRRTHAARSTLLQAPQPALGLGRLTAEEKCEVASAEMEAVQATADQVIFLSTIFLLKRETKN